MSKSKIDILIEVNAKTNELLQAQRRVGELRTKLLNMGKLGAAFLGVQVGIQAIGAALKQATAAGIGFNATLEQQTQALKTLMGSADAARSRMSELVRFSAQTPFSLEEVVQANRYLQTFGGEVLATNDALRLVGDAAAASGRGFAEVAMWIGRLYSGLQAGQPVGEATLRLLEMGVVSADAKARIESLSGTSMSGAAAMAVLEQSFAGTAGAMMEQATTFNGLMSTFRDGMQIIVAAAAEPVFEDMKAALQDLVAGLDDGSPKLRIFGQMLADVFRSVVAVTGALAAAAPYIAAFAAMLAAVKLGSFVSGLARAASGLRLLGQTAQAVQIGGWAATFQRTTFAVTTATGALAKMRAGVLAVGAAMKAAFLANPIGIIVTAVTTIATGLWLWQSRQRAIAAETRKTREENDRIIKAWPTRIAQVESEADQLGLIRDLEQEIAMLREEKLNPEQERTLRLLQEQVRQTRNLTEADKERHRLANEARRAAETNRANAAANLEALRAPTDPAAQLARMRERLATMPQVDTSALDAEHARLIELRNQIESEVRPEITRAKELLAQTENPLSRRNIEESIAAVEAPLVAVNERIAANDARIAAARDRLDLVQRIEEAEAAIAAEDQQRRVELSRYTREALDLDKQATEAAYADKTISAQSYLAEMQRIIDARLAAEISAIEESEQSEEAKLQAIANLRRATALERAALERQVSEDEQNRATALIQAEIDLAEAKRETLRYERDLAQQRGDGVETQRLVKEEQDLVDELALAYGRLAEALAATDAAAAEAARGRATALRGERDTVGAGSGEPTKFARTQAAFYSRGDAANSYQNSGEALTGGLMEYATQLGTVWDQMAAGVSNIAQSITNGIGNAIQGLITRTMFWGEALRNIGGAILSAVINMFAQMAAAAVAGFIATKLGIEAISKTSMASSAAASASAAGAVTAAWVPAAMAASIATFGGAAAAGASAFALAMLAGAVAASLAAGVAAVGMAAFGGAGGAAGGGFAAGGYTPAGHWDQPAGTVHAGEWVAPQWQVRHPVWGGIIARLEQARIGRGAVNYISPGAGYAGGGMVAGPSIGSAAAAGGDDRPRKVVLVMARNMREAAEHERDPEYIVQVVKDNKGEIFL